MFGVENRKCYLFQLNNKTFRLSVKKHIYLTSYHM